ncbi:MAG: hypothetical protein U0228_18300 [Myxococcaceae bacterium]
MKRALFALVLAGSSCSLLFDPSKVDGGASGDDASTSCTPPTAPTYLEAVAGEAPDRLTWRWDSTAGAYQFCAQNAGGARDCVDVNCGAGTCEYVQNGLTADVRVTGTVAPRDCMGPLPSSATSSAKPIDVTSPAAWTSDMTFCGSFSADVNGGQIAIDQNGLVCGTSFVTGDSELTDLTFDFEIKLSATGGVTAGPIIHAQGVQRQRFGAVVGDASNLTPLSLSERSTGFETKVASGLRGLDNTEWVKVRVVAVGPTISYSQADTPTSPMVEVLRWTDRDQLAHKGQIGFGGGGSGHFDVRNLRVTNRGVLPAAPSEQTWAFGLDGGPVGSRQTGIPFVVISCPPVAGCDAGCVPPAGADCGVLRKGVGFQASTTVALSPPHGLDPDREWELSMRFTFGAGGTGLNHAIATVPGPILESNPPNTWLVAWQLAPAQTVEDGRWHLVTMRFPTDGGLISGTLDGAPYLTTTPTPANRTLESLQFGDGTNSAPLVVHEFSVKQL